MKNSNSKKPKVKITNSTAYNNQGKLVKMYVPSNDSDEEQPEYLFGLTSNALLIGIINGQIDAVELAKKALSDRGYDLNNKWVGFDKSAELLGIKK